MNIKFKKMFKTAVIFFIIFVMIFNSFAAISVSDGSAFVTKAEFSADLNNLSNRMSALENSIDAKIDSLVSSYLSRNGIWNGEKQTIDYTSNDLGLKSGTRNTNLYLLHQYTYLNPSNEAAYFVEVNNNFYPVVQLGETKKDIPMIEQISKSGLLALKYNFFRRTYRTSSSGTDVDTKVSIQPAVIKNGGTFRYSEQNYLDCSVRFYLNQNPWVDANSSSLGLVSGNLTLFAQAIPNVEEYGNMLYTFVEKGKPLYVTESISTTLPANACCWKVINGAGGVDGSVKFSFEPTAAYVY